MDLESECDALESVEDNDVNTQTIPPGDGNEVMTNGSSIGTLGSAGNLLHTPNTTTLPTDSSVIVSESKQNETSPTLAAKSPSAESPPTTKGRGLRKWRRIKRDFIDDMSAHVDTSKALKRGFSTSSNWNKPQHSMKQSSEGSLRPVGPVDGMVFHGSSSNSNSRHAVNPVFAANADSENSEDMSGRSSTAASAPKNRVKSASVKNSGNFSLQVQQREDPIEGSKKARGEKIKILKENSHSSMESDSRSSNHLFMQGTYSATSNGKQSVRSMNYDGESEEAHASAQQFGEGVENLYRKENEGEEDFSHDGVAANLSWSSKEAEYRNRRSSTDEDPLVESILNLQSVKQALEKEVEKLGEIGKDIVSTDSSINGGNEDSSYTDPEICERISYDCLGSDKFRHTASGLLKAQVLSFTEKVKILESKLGETDAVLDAKQSRVAELEATIKRSKLAMEGSVRTVDLEDERIKEMESYIEGLFQEKIQAEVEYLAIRRAIEKLKGEDRGDQVTTPFEEQKTLAEEQAEMMKALGEAESRAAKLKKQAKEVEKYCGDIIGNEEVWKMQKRVCMAGSCFVIQLVLLVLAFWVCLSQPSPGNGIPVPT